MILYFILKCALLSAVSAQPTICDDDAQCQAGYFCDPASRGGVCRECIACEDLKRESPSPLPVCTKLISECGPCFLGLVEDRSGSLLSQCVTTESLGNRSQSSPYMWVPLAVGIPLAVVIIAVIAYIVLRNFDTMKIRTSTRASLQSPFAPPRADPPPPPYNASAPLYAPVRPATPPNHLYSANGPQIAKEESWRLRAPRERDSNQEAQLFNNPHYVRGPELPPSYDSALNTDPGPDLHDENTMESLWTPTDDSSTSNTNINSVSEGASSTAAAGPSLAALLDEARRDRSLQPPAKILCVRPQDGNNNGGNRAAAGEAGEGPSSSPAPPPLPPLTALNFNITVQQHNDVKLIST